MNHARSSDGTEIAYSELGAGPPVILVAGAFCTSEATAPLASALASRGLTAVNVDRRGRGDSGDSVSYEVSREVEDLAAVIQAAGGSAAVFGHSSGATLALRAAAAGLPITALMLYEPPILVDGSRSAPPADLADRLERLLAEGRRGDAVELYQLEGVGLPPQVVAELRSAPFRAGLEAIAHTLPYDARITGDLSLPSAANGLDTQTLVLAGGSSWHFLQTGAAALADALPGGRLQTLDGETHDINPEPTAAAIAGFLER